MSLPLRTRVATSSVAESTCQQLGRESEVQTKTCSWRQGDGVGSDDGLSAVAAHQVLFSTCPSTAYLVSDLSDLVDLNVRGRLR